MAKAYTLQQKTEKRIASRRTNRQIKRRVKAHDDEVLARHKRLCERSDMRWFFWTMLFLFGIFVLRGMLG